MKILDLKNPFEAPVYYLETVASTFDIARLLAADNEKHGAVITADFQEAGRGRPICNEESALQGSPPKSRSWVSERGKNLLFTIMLRYADISSIPKALALKTGIAVSQAVEDLAPALAGKVLVKWPNDVMVCTSEPCKVAGILIEGDGTNIYIGVGVNVAQREFPEEYRAKAGSLSQAGLDLGESAKFVLLEKILSRLFCEIETGQELNETWRERLLKRLYKLGETVTFAEGAAGSGRFGSGRLIEGEICGIGPDGELLIIPKGEKEERAFINGELRVY